MSGLDNHLSEVVQNLLTNVTVGRDINIDTIQQIAQQIVIQVADNNHTNQVATLITTQVLELFKTENGNVKKTIVLQLLRTCQYNEDFPVKLREEANNLYAEFESLSPAEFKDLFTPSGNHNRLNQKLALFLLGLFTGVSVNKLKEIWKSWVLVDNDDINSSEAILTKDYNISILSENPEYSETETSNFQDNNKHKNTFFNTNDESMFGLKENIKNELNYKELIVLKILQESQLINEIDIQNLSGIEVQQSIISLEEIEKIISDSDMDFEESSSDHEYNPPGEEHDLDDGDDFEDDFFD